MCNCIKDIEEKALERLVEQKRFKRPIKRVEMMGIIFPFAGGTLSVKTANTLCIELEGQKRKHEISMAHSYCPFCGDKYESAPSEG